MTTDQLSRALTETLDAVVPPPPDLAAVRTRGRRLGRRRRTTVAAVAFGAVAAGWVGAYQLAGGTAEVIRPDSDIAVPGGFGMENGLRAVASPGVRLFLGDTSVPLEGDFFSLDTDAAASSYGVLYTDDDGAVQLLEPTGSTRALTENREVPRDAHPTIKVDNRVGHAAWATLDGTVATLTVYDLAAEQVVATSEFDCTAACDELVIEAVDRGYVVVRSSAGVAAWDYEDPDATWEVLASPRTQVADVRNGVMLHAGAAPLDLPRGWRAVQGPVDGQLTFDGAYIVAWDKVLTPTRPGARPIRLDAGRSIFFTVDTDGSVLTATLSPHEAFDCEIPSGVCEKYADLPPGGGDPLHIGADM